MVGGTRIIAFEPGGQEPSGEELLLSQEFDRQEPEAADRPEAHLDASSEDAPDHPVSSRQWLWPSLATLAIAGWTAFFAWAKLGEIVALTAPPAAAPGLVGDWLTPVLLIGLMWLVFMRNSRREALRFGDTARILSDESARLETRLLTVNRELSLAREFIASQSRDLESLGRIAVERLSQNSERLQSLIVDNGARIDSIGTVSEAALDNMEKLRGQLPVIASSAKDVTNNIGNAGRTAAAQLGEMVSGFERLNSFGQASERQVVSLRSQVDEALAEFARQCEQLGEIAGNRFAMLTERGAEFRGQLDTHEADALAAVRARAEALAAEVAETRQALDSQESESLTSLRARLSSLRDEGSAISRAIREGETRSVESWRAAVAQIDADLHSATAALEGVESQAVENARTRLAALSDEAADFEARLGERAREFDAEMARRQTALEQRGDAFAAHSEGIAARLAECEHTLADIAARGGEAEAKFAGIVQALISRLGESRTALSGTDREIAQLTDSSVRLLEILQASKQQARDELQDALSVSEKRLAAFESRVMTLREAVVEAGERGENLSGLIASSGADLRAAVAEIEQLQAAFGQSNHVYGEALAGLRQALTEVEEQSTRLSEKAQGELSTAIERLLASARETVATIGETGAQTISALASQLGTESGAAIDQAMRTSAAEATGQLEAAARQAAGVSREAAIQLRDQLGKVNDLVGNLERRVAHARSRAEEQVDNDFSRRAALITESLNSNAIDIARALASDVSDTAWSAYLKGDRGIFTRRAVNLLESGEAKSIVQLFEADPQFREHVSRYIHDFEAILRQVLSTRDGHALGVTLLSSDMGKLYVTLAQAIERLRN